MLRRIRLLGLWCVLVLVVGVAPAAAADDAATPAAESGVAVSGEPAAVLVAEPSDGPGVVVADDPVVTVADPWSWVVGLPDPDAGRAGLVAGRAVVVVDADGPAAVAEGLPVWVSADSSLSADVEVLPADAGLSPFGVALLVDLSAAGGVGAADGVSGAASVVLDYSAVRLGYSAGVADRLRIQAGVDCRVDEAGAIVCGGWLPVPAVNDPLARSISFEVADGDAGRGRRGRRLRRMGCCRWLIVWGRVVGCLCWIGGVGAFG